MSYLVQYLEEQRGNLVFILEPLGLHHRLMDTGIILHKTLQDHGPGNSAPSVGRPLDSHFFHIWRLRPPELSPIKGALRCVGRRHRRWWPIVYPDDSARAA